MTARGRLEMTPKFFSHERGEGMEQAQTGIQNPGQGIRGIVCSIPTFSQLKFCDLEIPIGKLIPEEIVDLPPGLPVLEACKEPLHFFYEGLQPCPDPRVRQGPFRVVLRRSRRLRKRSKDEAGRVPDLIGKIAVGLDFFETQNSYRSQVSSLPAG